MHLILAIIFKKYLCKLTINNNDKKYLLKLTINNGNLVEEKIYVYTKFMYTTKLNNIGIKT